MPRFVDARTTGTHSRASNATTRRRAALFGLYGRFDASQGSIKNTFNDNRWEPNKCRPFSEIKILYLSSRATSTRTRQILARMDRSGLASLRFASLCIARSRKINQPLCFSFLLFCFFEGTNHAKIGLQKCTTSYGGKKSYGKSYK